MALRWWLSNVHRNNNEFVSVSACVGAGCPADLEAENLLSGAQTSGVQWNLDLLADMLCVYERTHLKSDLGSGENGRAQPLMSKKASRTDFTTQGAKVQLFSHLHLNCMCGRFF